MGDKELLELQSQLFSPNGEKGKQIADMMFESNTSMTLNTFKYIGLQSKSNVLELGHGNCRHLPQLFDLEEFSYYGLEISETMFLEAKKNNEYLLAKAKVQFNLYDGNIIPFKDQLFDSIFTVNTIYFWNNAKVLLNELKRVLRNNGTLVICYANKSFMKNLPFVQDKFKLYDINMIEELIENSSFKVEKYKCFKEHVVSKSGDPVEREYTVVKLSLCEV